MRGLFLHFLERFSRQHRARPRRVDPDVYPYLESYSWPGNVRELRNLCERLVVFGGDPVTPDQLPSGFFEPARPPESGLLLLSAACPVLSLREFKARCEREYIESTPRPGCWTSRGPTCTRRSTRSGARRPERERDETDVPR